MNYAQLYLQAILNAIPEKLYFSEIYTANNKNDVKFVNAKTINIPVISVTGRKNGSTETIGTKAKNFSLSYETKTLTRHRTWETLVHPTTIQRTNLAASIANITKVFNSEQKFPEMDAYAVSQIYALKNAITPVVLETEELTVDNVLSKLDAIIERFDNESVPQVGRIAYVTPAVQTLIQKAIGITRTATGKTTQTQIVTTVDEYNGLIIKKVPNSLMKTAYDFSETNGYSVADTAKQIGIFALNLYAVIPAISYESVLLDAPAAGTGGNWDYFEEAFEDIFIFNERAKAIEFVVLA